MSDRRIVILGFMGCGKTTVGTELARRLNCRFTDLDSLIGERQGRSPAEIIEQDSEESFREIETLVLRDVLQDHDARVIALGGGTWIVPANRTLIALYDCLSVWVDAPFELCWKRIATSPKTVRPLAPDRETTKSRYESRRADYALAEQRLTIDESTATETVVEEIVRQS